MRVRLDGLPLPLVRFPRPSHFRWLLPHVGESPTTRCQSVSKLHRHPGPPGDPSAGGEPRLLPHPRQLQAAKENTASHVVILVVSRLPFQTPLKATPCGDRRSWEPLLTGGELRFLKMTSGCLPATARGPHLSPVSLASSLIYLHISVSCVVFGFDFY